MSGDAPTWRFHEDAGLIEADLGPQWPGFNHALSDSVTSRAPRGHPEGLSTYWTDRTLDAVALGEPEGTVIASGNATALVYLGDSICARSDYGLHDDELMPTGLFIKGLEDWRALVVDRLAARSDVRDAE